MFDSTQDLMKVRRVLMPEVKKNQASRQCAEIYKDDATLGYVFDCARVRKVSVSFARRAHSCSF